MLASRKPVGRVALGVLALLAAGAMSAGSVQATTGSVQAPKSAAVPSRQPLLAATLTDGKTPGVPKGLANCKFFRIADSASFPCLGPIINSGDGWQTPMKANAILPITFRAKSTQTDPATGAVRTTQSVCWHTVGPYAIVAVFAAVPDASGALSYPRYASGLHTGCASIPSGLYLSVEARPQASPQKPNTKSSSNPDETDGKTPGVPKNLSTCAFFRKAYSQNFPCPGSIINVWDGWQPPARIPMLPITFGAKSQPVNPVNGASATQNVCWKTVGAYAIVGVFVANPIGEGNYSYPSFASGPHSGCADIPGGLYIIVEARPQLPATKG